MSSENKAGLPIQDSATSNRNALTIKIAMALNYLSKSNYQKLILDLQKKENNTEPDIFKLLLGKDYVDPQEIATLKKTCLNFIRIQEDARFGALCINFKFLTQSNLNLALEEQKRLAAAGRNVLLGELLVEAGMLSERQRNLILHKQKLEITSRKNRKSKPVDEKAGHLEKPVFDKTRMQEIREVEITILIQTDALKAFVIKTNDFNNSMPLSDLKFLLEKNGIIYGIVDDDSLSLFIKDNTYGEQFFEIAKGLDPIDGTDAQIVYMFEKDYLKAGYLAEDGTMDFKNRGDIPFVAKGDILAEKIPLKEGKEGVNIYGEAIPSVQAEDMSFFLGKGVRLSKDQLTVVADVDGIPKVEPGNEISVNDACFIEGDVDYSTGHIKFNKNVYITGSIKSGFRVEAIDVVAKTIDGGFVNAQGDVFIQNSVTESIIQAKGSIKAGFMHRSKAACMGNMNILKEIVDTDIILEGTFEMNRGRMFSSSVCAKGGAKIYNIGSEKAGPSIITVGTSHYLEKQLQDMNATLEKNQNTLEELTKEKNKIEIELNILHEKSTDVDALQKNPDFTDQKTILESRLNKTNHDISTCTEAVKKCMEEKFALKLLTRKNPPKPVLEVAGKVLAGTKICGRYANLVLSQNLSRSKIMEINSRNDDGSVKGWELIVTNL